MMTSPRATLMRWKRLNSVSMLAGGRLAKMPRVRFSAANMPDRVRQSVLSTSAVSRELTFFWGAANWSHVSMISSTSSSMRTSSMSVIALLAVKAFGLIRGAAWRPRCPRR
jgi:hypothetical protein